MFEPLLRGTKDILDSIEGEFKSQIEIFDRELFSEGEWNVGPWTLGVTLAVWEFLEDVVEHLLQDELNLAFEGILGIWFGIVVRIKGSAISATPLKKIVDVRTTRMLGIRKRKTVEGVANLWEGLVWRSEGTNFDGLIRGTIVGALCVRSSVGRLEHRDSNRHVTKLVHGAFFIHLRDGMCFISLGIWNAVDVCGRVPYHVT